jgi:hypothetical protein
MKFVRQFYKQTGCPGKINSSAAHSYHGGTSGPWQRAAAARVNCSTPDAIPQGLPTSHYRDRFDTEEDEPVPAESVEG